MTYTLLRVLAITAALGGLTAAVCWLMASLAGSDRLADVDAPDAPATPTDPPTAYLAWLEAALTPWWRGVLATIALEETSG